MERKDTSDEFLMNESINIRRACNVTEGRLKVQARKNKKKNPR